MKKTDYHAKLVIHDLPTMSPIAYKRLIDWLRQQAKNFVKEGGDKKIYAKRYTARLMK